MLKQLLTLTLRELCPELSEQPEPLSENGPGNENIDPAAGQGNGAPTTIVPPLKTCTELPWDMKMGFWHPLIDGLVVVASADMSHSIKKMDNALKLSGNQKSKRALELDGKPLSLEMLKDIWLLCPDADPKNKGEFICCSHLFEF